MLTDYLSEMLPSASLMRIDVRDHKEMNICETILIQEKKIADFVSKRIKETDRDISIVVKDSKLIFTVP